MALQTKCQTPNTVYDVHIGAEPAINVEQGTLIDIKIQLPHKILMGPEMDEAAELLELNIHNALELVLAPYFKEK